MMNQKQLEIHSCVCVEKEKKDERNEGKWAENNKHWNGVMDKRSLHPLQVLMWRFKPLPTFLNGFRFWGGVF